MTVSKHKDTAVFGRILAVTGRAKYGPLFFSIYKGREGQDWPFIFIPQSA